MKPRVTQKDVAREAGVSHTTVSLALRSHPSIPEKTKKRVRKICQRLGYSPDPMLSRLSAYRTSMRPLAYQSTIGWLNPWSGGGPISGEFGLYYRGASNRAGEHGFRLEDIRLADIDYNAKRLDKILKAKNISGILLPPFPSAGAKLQVNFSHISAVRFGFSYNHPQLHTVVNAQFRTALLTVQTTATLGYDRIGIILNHDQDLRTNWNFLGGYLAASSNVLPLDRIEPFYPKTNNPTPEELRMWIVEKRCQCVIGLGHWNAVKATGLGVGYADLSVAHDDHVISGMYQNPLEIGSNALDLLNLLIHRGDVGIPVNPMTITIDSVWRKGTTLKPQEGKP